MRRANLCLFRIEPVALDQREQLQDSGCDGGDGEEQREDRRVVREDGE